MTGDLGPFRGEIGGGRIWIEYGVVKSVGMLERLGWLVTEYRMQQNHKLGVRILRMLRMQI